jgi:hypothetical protein
VETSQLSEIIKTVLKSYSHPNSQLEERFVFDTEQHVYQWLKLGWEGMKRAYWVYIHIEICDGLLWVERNNVEPSVVELLLEHGIPKEKIVLAFHAPYKRGMYGFATGEA